MSFITHGNGHHFSGPPVRIQLQSPQATEVATTESQPVADALDAISTGARNETAKVEEVEVEKTIIVQQPPN